MPEVKPPTSPNSALYPLPYVLLDGITSVPAVADIGFISLPQKTPSVVTVAVTLSGSANLVPEVSLDGVTWYTLTGLALVDQNPISAIVASGAYVFRTSGWLFFRLKPTAVGAAVTALVNIAQAEAVNPAGATSGVAGSAASLIGITTIAGTVGVSMASGPGGSSASLVGVTTIAGGSISVAGGGIVSLASGISISGGSVSVAGGGVVSLASGISVSGGSLSIAGGGVASLIGVTTIAGGSVSVAGGGVASLIGVTTIAGGSVSIAGGGVASLIGVTTIAGGSLSIAGGGVASLIGVTTIAGGSISIAGGGVASLIGVTTIAGGSLSIAGGSAVSISNGLSISGGSMSISGGGLTSIANTVGVSFSAVLSSAPTIGVLSVSGGQLSITGGGVVSLASGVSISGGVLSIAGGGLASIANTVGVSFSAVLSSAPTIGVLSISGGQISIAGGGVVSLASGVSVSGGVLSITGGGLTSVANTVGVSFSAVLSSAPTIGVLSISGGQLSISGGGVASLIGVTTIAGGSISIAGGGVASLIGVTTIAGGSLSIAGGGVVSLLGGISVAGGLMTVYSSATSVLGLSTLSVAGGSAQVINTNQNLSLSGVYSAGTGLITMTSGSLGQNITIAQNIITCENPANSGRNVYLRRFEMQAWLVSTNALGPKNPGTYWNLARITGTLGTAGGTTVSSIQKLKSSYISPALLIHIAFASTGGGINSTLAGVSALGNLGGYQYPNQVEVTRYDVVNNAVSSLSDFYDDLILLPGEGIAVVVAPAQWNGATTSNPYVANANVKWREGLG